MNAAEYALRVVREGLYLMLLVSAPGLLASMVVGLVCSVLQAATQVQEQTLTFIPKTFAVVLTLFVLMPWLLGILVDYTHEIFLTWIQEWR